VTLAAPSAAGVALTEAELEANAAALQQAHGALVNELIRRRVPLSDAITLVSTSVYSDLLHSVKLMSTDFSLGNGNFADRRIAKLNGVPVVESVAFPTS